MFKAANALGQYTRHYTHKRIQSRADLDTDKETVEKRGYEDILAHLINNKDDETGTVYSENELLGEATLLMMAGKYFAAFAKLPTCISKKLTFYSQGLIHQQRQSSPRFFTSPTTLES